MIHEVNVILTDIFSVVNLLQMGFYWMSWTVFFALMGTLFIQLPRLIKRIKSILSFGINWWIWLQQCVGDSLLEKSRLQYGLKKIMSHAFCTMQSKSL